MKRIIIWSAVALGLLILMFFTYEYIVGKKHFEDHVKGCMGANYTREQCVEMLEFAQSTGDLCVSDASLARVLKDFKGVDNDNDFFTDF
jgi:hypothetical protein